MYIGVWWWFEMSHEVGYVLSELSRTATLQSGHAMGGPFRSNEWMGELFRWPVPALQFAVDQKKQDSCGPTSKMKVPHSKLGPTYEKEKNH